MVSVVDFRSDTVTLPPPEMRRAMYEAELGDDVYGEDPSINALQERIAGVLGTEAALFVSSGTMGNLVAVLSHCGRGDEIIVGDQSHMFLYEGGGSSVLGGTVLRTVSTAPDGTLPLDELRAAIRTRDDPHQARSGLIGLENTHNRRGGAALSPDYMQCVREIAREDGVPVHLDGARLFNAAVALRCPARDLARHADSVSICFSKGLAAPVGSALCGTRDFIAEALRWRKMVGGGMRQAGVLAAAALYALDHMVERLTEDHDNARLLSEGLCEIEGVRPGQPRVQTDIVLVDVAATGLTADAFAERLAASGVLCSPFGGNLIRFVTHYGIERADVAEALRRARRALLSTAAV